MNKMLRGFLAAFAVFFYVDAASAQNAGTVTNHAFPIGKGAGVTGYGSLLLGSGQIAIGQTSADPSAITPTGDVTINAAGVTAIGTAKVVMGMIALNAVDNARLAQMANGSIKCRTTAGTGNQEDCTAAQVRTILALVIGTNVQAWDTDLDCLAALSTSGIISRTGAGTCAVRTLTAPAAGIAVTNGDGASGNPTLALANDLAALEALSGTNTIYYRSGVDTWSPVTIGTGITFTSGTLAATGGGSTSTPGPPQGRLTVQTATPVMSTTQSAKTTFYYTPYVGNQIPIWDGTTMTMTTFPEVNIATTDTAKNPAAIGASKVNDWFIWNDSGTLRLSHGPDWTSDTARSAGTALTMVNGVLLNSVSITNGPAASRGTYVGTTRSNASSQLDWIYGASASGGSAGFFGIWNMYNRVNAVSTVMDSGAFYSYTSTTIRQARASAGNQITFVVGLSEDGVSLSGGSSMTTVAVAGAGGGWGVGLNSTSTYAFTKTGPIASTANAQTGIGTASGLASPQLGVNVASLNENSDGTNANLFVVSGAASLSLLVRN